MSIPVFLYLCWALSYGERDWKEASSELYNGVLKTLMWYWAGLAYIRHLGYEMFRRKWETGSISQPIISHQERDLQRSLDEVRDRETWKNELQESFSPARSPGASDFQGGLGETIRTYITDKIVSYLEPLRNKLVQLTDTEFKGIIEFVRDKNWGGLEQFEEFMTTFKNMGPDDRKEWIGQNWKIYTETVRNAISKFKSSDAESERDVLEKDYGDTESGCNCKTDGEKGFNYLTRKFWCEIDDPRGYCVEGSRDRCVGWDDEEGCAGYYWDYKNPSHLQKT